MATIERLYSDRKIMEAEVSNVFYATCSLELTSVMFLAGFEHANERSVEADLC